MQKVFVLQAQGFGDNEDEFYNIGVYTTMEKLKAAQADVDAEGYDGCFTAVYNVEEWQLDA